MAAGFEGYLYGVGRIGLPMRVLVLIGACGFLYPDYRSYAATAIGVAVVYLAVFVMSKRKKLAAG